MKVDEIKDGLRQLGVKDLKEKIDALRRELFSLKINAATAHVKDYSKFKKLRKDIARALTFLRQVEEQNKISA